MTTHLSDAELVDAAERTLAPARRAHLDSCDRCRSAMDYVASTLREISAIVVPEPSPLFWDHFSGRVHDAVAAEELDQSRSAWLARRASWMQIAAFCVVLVAVVSAGWFVRARSEAEAKPAMTVASATDSHATSGASLEVADVADDPAWAVLSAAAAGLSEDETPSAALTVRPAAIDTAVQQLTPRERNELRRLLQSEMKHSSD